MNVENAVIPTPEQIKELSEDGHDRPIYMVNLLKFKEHAEYADGRETTLTGREAYRLYIETANPVGDWIDAERV